MNDTEYTFLKRRTLELTGIDLGNYKVAQMHRRLDAWLTRSGAQNWSGYFRRMEAEPQELQRFRDYLTINVSSFFRDREKFDQLRAEILPTLLRENRRLKVWSAGCSHGAEAYSLAILLEELAPFRPHTILATDIDQTALAKAGAGGPYTADDLREVKPERVKRYFKQNGEGYYVVPQLVRKVRFSTRDLLEERFENGFDLIVCRNVVIYFVEEAKRTLYAKFYDALREGGVLFVGATEIVSGAKELGFENMLISFYRKPRRPQPVSNARPRRVPARVFGPQGRKSHPSTGSG